jgi:hypothetical protein
MEDPCGTLSFWVVVSAENMIGCLSMTIARCYAVSIESLEKTALFEKQQPFNLVDNA